MQNLTERLKQQDIELKSILEEKREADIFLERVQEVFCPMFDLFILLFFFRLRASMRFKEQTVSSEPGYWKGRLMLSEDSSYPTDSSQSSTHRIHTNITS